MTKWVSVFAAALLALVIAAPAHSASMPSSKAAAALGEIYALGTAAAEANPGTPVNAQDTGWVTIARSHIKTPSLKDLSFDVAMQCGINTFTSAVSKGGNKDTAVATGAVTVRVKVTTPDGGVRYAVPNEEGKVDQGVTYCSRVQELSATFQGIIEGCIAADGTINITDDCLQPEEVSLLLKTLSAGSFNFLAPDVPPGIQMIEVQARGQASSALFGSQLGSAKGEAFVGVGSMRVETIRMIKNADLGPIDLE